MFRIIQPNTWYADPHGAPCKILRATHEVIHYIRNGRTCIASMGRFQHEFEPLTKAQAERIAEEIETAEHLKRLRAMQLPIKPNSPSGLFLRPEINECE